MVKNAEGSTGQPRRTAVVYARVSTEEQEREGYSIPAQLALLVEYARSNNYDIIKQFSEAKSASKLGRPEYGNMLKFVRTSPEPRPTILVEKTDRLYRNDRDKVELLEVVKKYGFEVILVKEGQRLASGMASGDKLMHHMMTGLAVFQTDRLSEEVIKGMNQKALTGIFPTYTPTGYLNVHTPDGKKIIVPDPERAPFIKRLFELYASGSHSIDSVTKIVTQEGLRSKSGKALGAANIHTLLQRRIYCGYFDYAGKTYEGTHEPIVDIDLWMRVQEMLAGRSPKSRRQRRHEYAYSGLIKCGYSGRLFSGDQKKGKYVYYSPAEYDGPGKRPFVPEKVLDEIFVGILKNLEFEDEILEWIKGELKESNREKQAHQKSRLDALTRDFDKLEKRIDSMYFDKLDGNITQEEYDTRRARLRQEQDRIRLGLEALQASSESFIEDSLRLLELAKKAHKLFVSRKPEEKRQLLEILCSNSTWKDGELHIELHEPFATVGVTNEKWKEKGVAEATPDAIHHSWLPD